MHSTCSNATDACILYSLEQLRRSEGEVQVVLGVDVEFDRLVGRLEPRPVNLEVNWSVVRFLDDVQLYAERFRHRPWRCCCDVCGPWPTSEAVRSICGQDDKRVDVERTRSPRTICQLFDTRQAKRTPLLPGRSLSPVA